MTAIKSTVLTQTITAKLKLYLSYEQKELVRQTTLAYRDALNYASHKAFELGKTTSQIKLHKAVYTDLRTIYTLPSQMACEVSKQVTSTYKGLWTKVKQNAQHLKQGKTKKRYKGLDKAPKFVSGTLTLNYGKDFSFVKNQVSIKTLGKRIKVDFSGYNKHLELLKLTEAKVEIGTAKIWYCKSSKTYYLLVSLALNLPKLKATDVKQVLGVDVGQRYLAVSTDTKNNTRFYSGKKTVHKANRYHRARKTLQQKGTRRAKTRLVSLSKRERRFKADVNHSLASQLIKPNSLIGLEHLTNIRERTNRRKNKKASVKRKKANSKQSRWAFAQLQGFVEYKAKLNDAIVVKVDADYSSVACPCCGHTSQENRPDKGLIFSCVACNYTLHADLVGARNVAMRAFSVWQDWTETGNLSIGPNVANEEAKAERLSRYSELKWSLATSPTHNL